MFINVEYDREAAVLYAERWAHSRNPRFLDFDGLGGDCTNFVSQCIYAGCKVMNYTRVFGWYYKTAGDRSAAWTGVSFLHDFLVGNEGAGPYAAVGNQAELKPGDIVQLGDGTGKFYHSLVAAEVHSGEIYVAAHTFDAFMRPLSSYDYGEARFLHIAGYRKQV